MKNQKQSSIEDLQGELGACERVLATLGPEEAKLATKVTSLRQDRERHVKGGGGGDLEWGGRRIPASVRLAVKTIDAELPALEVRLSEVQPQVATAAARANEIRAALSAETRGAVERILAEALVAAPSYRQFLDEKQKLASLHVKMNAANAELQKANDAAARAIAAQNDSRAASSLDRKAIFVLEQGEVPRKGELEDSLSAEVQKAKGNVEVIARAIEIQREVIQRISGELAGELETVLRPARSVIVQRIANGFREACEATEELELIEQAVQRETLGRGLMPLKFHAVQTIYDRSQHPFVNWLTERRRDGFAV